MADEHLISLQPGTVIAGRYEVVKCLGAGSMGLVYACRHRELAGHLVAVKVLFPEVAQDKVAAARFRNEIFASYGVSHPNVVRAYEYLRDGDLVAYTMEYVGGGDLAERLSSKEPIPVPEIIDIMSQMCSGVQAIHDAGIVHRDLKPENILLSREGHVKIADFGIARTGQGPRLTEHGGVVGTIDYVSPEYMLNSQVDWRSDIYAIGILGYEMTTGESPFRGDSVYATMTKRLKEDPIPPSQKRSDVPRELDQVILLAMARDPEERYQSAAEIFYDLQKLLPEGQRSSGAYLKSNGSKGGAYVGPVLQESTEENGVVAEDGSEQGTESRVDSRERELSPTSTSLQPRTLIGEEPEVTYPPEQQKTQVLIPNSIPQTGFDNDTIHEPERMESVLGRGSSSGSGGWGEPQSKESEVYLSHGGIDDKRIRRLSQHVDMAQRAAWVDLVTFIIVILLGVGVGFALMKVVWPDLLSDKGPGHETVEVWSDSGS